MKLPIEHRALLNELEAWQDIALQLEREDHDELQGTDGLCIYVSHLCGDDKIGGEVDDSMCQRIKQFKHNSDAYYWPNKGRYKHEDWSQAARERELYPRLAAVGIMMAQVEEELCTGPTS